MRSLSALVVLILALLLPLRVIEEANPGGDETVGGAGEGDDPERRRPQRRPEADRIGRLALGIRAAGLAAELASAHLLLESGGVKLEYETPDVVSLPPDVETILALTIREGVTNIQRHARASRARVALAITAREAHLLIEDDGCGSAIEPGNGLTGMRERLRALDGDLVIASERGRGTRLEARVALVVDPVAAARICGRDEPQGI